jgi:hypothetical protein
MPSTIPLSRTIELATRYNYNAPLLYVNSGALAFSLGDEVRQFLLSAPFGWRWNRAEVAPITCLPGVTDYTVNIPDFGWLERAWILFPSAAGTPIQVFNSMNILSITAVAGVVTATVNGNPLNFGFKIGQTISVEQVTDTTFNAFQTLQISGLGVNTITYSQAGTGITSSGGIIFNISNLTVPVITTTGQPLPTKELSISNTLAQESVLGQPGFISVIADDNNGNITFRLMMAPDQAYTLYIIYQKAAPTFGAVTDTWDPLPDYMEYIFNKGFLAKAYEYKGDERFAFVWQEFLKMAVASNDGLSETEKNIFLEPKIITAREQGSLQSSAQARQSRGGA